MTTPEDESAQQAAAVRALDAAKRAVEFYVRTGCPQGGRIQVEVRTPTPLGREEVWVRDELERYPDAFPLLESVRVHFLPDPSSRSESAQVHAEDADPASEPGRPDPPGAATPGARYLELTAGSDARLSYRLPPLAAPVALMRSDRKEDRDRIRRAVWLPPTLTLVPTGHLLDLVGDDGAHAVRRTEERTEVDLSVDGLLVGPGETRRLDELGGTLRFTVAGGPQGSPLGYELTTTSTSRTGPTTIRGDLEPRLLTLRAGFRTVTLRIEPPALDVKVRRPVFPVWLDDGAGAGLPADLLTTTALTVDGDEAWHVKLYLCDTAQDAGALRRHFRAQIDAVDQANAAAHQEGVDQDVILPVHVAPAPSENTEARTTAVGRPGHAVREDLEAAPGGQFADWFGQGERPDPDRCVVVVSPWRTPVEWAQEQPTPGLEQLDRLQPVAGALDQLYRLGWGHGDVKPQNLCWEGGRYVLVDSDSLTRWERPEYLRPTWRYAAPAVFAQLTGATGDPLVPEHDRFGFALLVLTALGGIGLTEALVESSDRRRGADDPGMVEAALWRRWPAGHPHLIAALKCAFVPGALRESWTAEEWLATVRRAGDEDDGRPRDTTEAWTPDPVLQPVREEAMRLPRTQDRPARVAELMAAEIRRRAVVAERRTHLVYAAVPVMIGLIALLWAIVEVMT